MESEDKFAGEAETSQPPSPGTRLKAAREKLGMSQQLLADKLFLKVNQIADLEADRLDEKTSITFTKGYVRLYAKQVGLDDKQLLEEFDALHKGPKSPAKLQSFSKRVTKQAHDDRWMMVTYGILFLLVAGVVVWWYQQSGENPLNQPDDVGSATIEAPAESTPEPKAAARSDAFEPSASALNESPAPVPQDAQIEEVPASQTEPEVTQQNSLSEEDAQPAQAESPASDEQAADTEINQQAQTAIPDDAPKVEVTFTFGADCWVNIADATGEAIAYGVKNAGRVMTIEGVAPFDVTLGAPDNVTIVFDGEPVDISSFQNGRTARFSLPMQE